MNCVILILDVVAARGFIDHHHDCSCKRIPRGFFFSDSMDKQLLWTDLNTILIVTLTYMADSLGSLDITHGGQDTDYHPDNIKELLFPLSYHHAYIPKRRGPTHP
jgi:hypothetical protein